MFTYARRADQGRNREPATGSASWAFRPGSSRKPVKPVTSRISNESALTTKFVTFLPTGLLKPPIHGSGVQPSPCRQCAYRIAILSAAVMNGRTTKAVQRNGNQPIHWGVKAAVH